MTIDQARDEVSASSAGGAPFLIAYAATMLACGLLAFALSREVVALLALFQGSVALPLAFWLERRLRVRPASPDNPLRSLSVQLAMSQVVALPALIVAYSLEPGAVPVVLAAIGGGHFLPYAWLHRTNLYASLAGVVSLGGFGVQLVLGSSAFPYVLLLIAAAYAVAAPLVYRNASRLVAAATAAEALE